MKTPKENKGGFPKHAQFAMPNKTKADKSKDDKKGEKDKTASEQK